MVKPGKSKTMLVFLYNNAFLSKESTELSSLNSGIHLYDNPLKMGEKEIQSIVCSSVRLYAKTNLCTLGSSFFLMCLN